MKLPLETRSKIKVLVDSNLYHSIIFGQDDTFELAGSLFRAIASRQVSFCITEICLAEVIERLELEGIIRKFSAKEKELIKNVLNISINNTIESNKDIANLTSQYIKEGLVKDLRDFDAAVEIACVKSGQIGAIVSESLNKYENFNNSGIIVLTLKELYKRIYLENLLNLENASFKVSDADLTGLDLTGVNLRGVHIRRSNLSNSILSNSILSYSKLHYSNISRSNLSSSVLMHAILWGVNFTMSDLSKGNLSCADLSGANLSGSNLSSANLWGAILNDCNLTGADLSGANLTKTQLNNASLLNTKFSNNLGLDEKNIKKLKERGAIFS